jgi:lysozyme family protein
MMAGLSTWATFGRGWSKRLAQLPYQAAKMTGNDAPAASSSVDQPPAG